MHNPTCFIFLVALCLLCSAATATEMSAGSVAFNGIGQNAVVPITMDQVTDGLAGYTIDISVTDPSVAEITAVEYPEWASISSSSSLPAGEVRLKAVDLNREIQAGATNIPIATVTVKSRSAGSTTLQISPVRVSDDNGDGITPLAVQRTLTVITPDDGSGSGGAGGSSSGGGGSSGSGGGSLSSGGEDQVQPALTPNPTTTVSEEQLPPSADEQVVPAYAGDVQTVNQEDGNQVSQESAPSGTAPDWIKVNLLPVGILSAAAVMLLLFTVARMKTQRLIPDQIPRASRTARTNGGASLSGLEEGEKNRAIGSIIDALNDIDIQLSDLERVISKGGLRDSLSMHEASVVVERFFVSCQMAEDSIKRAAEKAQISKIQVYALNGQLSVAVRRMVSLSQKSEILASQLNQYGAQAGG